MSTFRVIAGLFVAALLSSSSVAMGHDLEPASDTGSQSQPQLETLSRAILEGVDETEIIVSRVTIPPHTSLPKHWHPGEEFAYVLEGSAVLWQEGKEEIVGEAGDVLKVPLRQVHTAITRDEGATILVFRVHAQGQPERVLVEPD